MPPKPITRLDARPDDLQRIENDSKQRAIKAAEEIRIEKEKNNTPEAIAKREKEHREREERNRKHLEDMWEKDRVDAMNELIKNPAGSFTYDDRVVVSNPIECGGCGDHAQYLNKIGLVKMQNGCKCLHKISDNCYWIRFEDSKENHHFEECELSKVK